MSIRSSLRETWAKIKPPSGGVIARIIPTWMAGRPLPAVDDVDKLAEEGYRRNILMAACIWCITSSASEPTLVVKRRKADGTLELAKGSDADGLRHLLEHPNPEQTTYTFLEKLFTEQQISGNWFFRKLRAEASNVVAIWPMASCGTKIVPDTTGWVKGYRYTGFKELIPAEDVVHDPLHPDPKDDFWGLSPIAVAARFVDLDNQAADFLRAFFTNNGTPAGVLKLKARMEPEERKRIQELWVKEHSGAQGWHSISVLDADADYQDIGATPGNKMGLEGVFNQTEARLCMAFGVPAICVGAVIGLNRSTFANFAEARKSLWQDTLVPLYKRCADRLTLGLASEFADDLVIEFDLSTVEALQEHHDSKRKFAFEGWDKGILTLNQVLELIGYPKVTEPEGELRKSAPAPAPEPGLDAQPAVGGLGNLLEGQRRHTHARAMTPVEKKALAKFQRVVQKHFAAQKEALMSHLEA